MRFYIFMLLNMVCSCEYCNKNIITITFSRMYNRIPLVRLQTYVEGYFNHSFKAIYGSIKRQVYNKKNLNLVVPTVNEEKY